MIFENDRTNYDKLSTERRIPLAQYMFHMLARDGLTEEIFPLALTDGRQLALEIGYVSWDDMLYSVLQAGEERDRLLIQLAELGLDQQFVYLIFVQAAPEGREPQEATCYIDRETFNVLHPFEKEYQWDFGVDGVIPDEIALALEIALQSRI
ncbi:MAG TPA: hypothetical protein VMW41_03200 [Candidatus Bathyarchaeia archaeon]|nr:hypothetical protein [Candidatus Bathyarchaeia archaeon]